MDVAKRFAQLSYAQRLKVGAIIVKDEVIISDGYNGTPTGFDNCCENDAGETKWYVLHAEANALMKLSKSTNSSKGATLYITLSPCKDCAKLILQAGIQRVVYLNEYKDCSGLEFLKNTGITLDYITI